MLTFPHVSTAQGHLRAQSVYRTTPSYIVKPPYLSRSPLGSCTGHSHLLHSQSDEAEPCTGNRQGGTCQPCWAHHTPRWPQEDIHGTGAHTPTAPTLTAWETDYRQSEKRKPAGSSASMLHLSPNLTMGRAGPEERKKRSYPLR